MSLSNTCIQHAINLVLDFHLLNHTLTIGWTSRNGSSLNKNLDFAIYGFDTPWKPCSKWVVIFVEPSHKRLNPYGKVEPTYSGWTFIDEVRQLETLQRSSDRIFYEWLMWQLIATPTLISQYDKSSPYNLGYRATNG